mmetsp:Transcript_60769/g.161446  ORF Transcript_60769/g.161446 Transcript_60769/m.161446 type:complete len:234 (-) Transcript_60769:68-769(-)
MTLAGKKALVFGGTSGIGYATVRQLLQLGATVVGISRDPSKAEPLAGVTFEKCDVLDREAMTKLFEAQAPFDILVNAATGGKRAVGPFLEMDLDGYQASFDKLWGYTNTVRLGTKHLTENGSIVLVSGAPARRCKPGQAAIASVGGAVEQFARAVAPEIVPRRINVVSPGLIETEMFGAAGDDRSSKLQAMTAKNLIPRPGTPDEVAQAIVYVATNGFVTGTTVDVDGGWLLS